MAIATRIYLSVFAAWVLLPFIEVQGLYAEDDVSEIDSLRVAQNIQSSPSKRPSLSEQMTSELDRELQDLKKLQPPQFRQPSPSVRAPRAAVNASRSKPIPMLRVPGVSGANPYFARVQARIAGFWTAPPADISGKELSVTVRFRIERDGRIGSVLVEQSSGNELYDMAAQRAVQSAVPFPPFPPDLSDSYFDAHFTFAVGAEIDAVVFPERLLSTSANTEDSSPPASSRNVQDPSVPTAEPTLIAPIVGFKAEIEKYDSQIRRYQEAVSSKHVLVENLAKDAAKFEELLKESEQRLGPLLTTLGHARIESDQTKKTLQTAIDNPRLVDAAKLESLLKESQVAASNLEQAQKAASIGQKDTDALKLRLEESRRQRRLVELEIAVTNRTILSLLMKRPVIVDGEGECAMHEDLTPKLCKEMALTKAKQDAVERGGTSLVQSYAEVSLNELIRDEITIETIAHVRQMEIVQPPTHISEGALGKYVAKIRAVVQNVGPTRSNQLPK